MNKKDFFRSLAEVVIEKRVFFAALWIVITIVSAFGALNIDKILHGEGSYVESSESYQQNILITKHFPEQYIKNIIVTLKSGKYKVEEPEFQKLITKITDSVKNIPQVGAVYDYKLDSSLLGKDGKSTFLMIGLKDTSLDVSSNDAPKILAKLKTITPPENISMHFTGTSIIVADMTRISERDGSKAEKKVLGPVILLMIFVFGAIVSAVLPVLIGVMSIVITLGCLYVVGHYFELAMFSKAIASMMGLGVGLDYCLFMVSRFREELLKGSSPKEAAIETTATAGKAVFYSGFAVSAGMGVLLIPELPLTRSVGFSGIFVVSIAIMLSLTFLPVIFSFLGPRINSPRAFHKLIKFSSTKNLWFNWSKLVMRKPLVFFLSGVSILLAISYFSLHMKLWNSSVLLMPDDLDSKQGFIDLMDIDPSRKYSPLGISFETLDGSSVYEPKNLEQIYKFANEISKIKDIRSVVGLVNTNSGMELDDYKNLYANTLMMQSLQVVQKNPFVNEDSTKSIMWAFHGESPKETADWDAVVVFREMRDKFNSHNMKIMIGGGGAINVDFQNAVYSDFPLIIALILLATYIIMFMLLGSAVLPLKAIFLNLLSVGASYGWLVLVFQYGLTNSFFGLAQPPGAILIITPLILFCIIFGLSMDYEIFMMSRIKEEYDKTGDIDQSVAMGLEKSGGIVTSAALIMIIVFSGFSFSEIILVQEMGLGLSTAVLIDATVIRSMLVPSIMKLLGDWAWWIPEILKDKFVPVKLDH